MPMPTSQKYHMKIHKKYGYEKTALKTFGGLFITLHLAAL